MADNCNIEFFTAKKSACKKDHDDKDFIRCHRGDTVMESELPWENAGSWLYLSQSTYSVLSKASCRLRKMKQIQLRAESA